MYIFALAPIVPVLIYLVDAYYERDIKKGLLYIATFALFGIVGILMLFLIGWKFALWTPFLLLAMLFLKPKNKHKDSNSDFLE